MLTDHAASLIAQTANQIAGPCWHNCEETELGFRLAECADKIAVIGRFELHHFGIVTLWRLVVKRHFYSLLSYPEYDYLRQATDEEVCQWCLALGNMIQVGDRLCAVQ